MPYSRQSISSSIDSRAAMKSKVLGDNTKGRAHKIDGMSPEAKKAMLLTKLEAKEGTSAARVSAAANTKTVKTSSSKLISHTTSYNNPASQAATKSAPVTGSTVHARKPVNISFDSGINVTGLSRSTVSHTAKTCSELIDSSDCIGENIMNNNNNCNGMKSVGKSHVLETYDPVENDDDIADNDSNSNGNEMDNTSSQNELGVKDLVENNPFTEKAPTNNGAVFPKSFVLALDKALEESCISRLRGDITDTSGISETGQVRALNGGRLANAQEVVVNVCYDDDKEIVFHDDDEETLDTAKTISHIRVNIWMEYNQDFVPDEDNISESDYPSIAKEKERSKDFEEKGHFLKVYQSDKKTPREKTTKPSVNIPKNTRNGSSPLGKDSNNNSKSIGSSWSKSGTNFSNASSKNGSVFTEDSKRSSTWSKKSESGLRRLSHK